MIPWTLCCLSVTTGLPEQKLTLNQPLVPMNLKLLFHIYVAAGHLEKCQQHEGLEIKIFNMLKFLQVYKIEVSIK
jgi:hypothetical protein